jgi:hypothetical protein
MVHVSTTVWKERDMPHTAISLQGDSEYKAKLSLLAKVKGLTVGQLVRIALDAQFGSEMDSATLFFESGGSQMKQCVAAKGQE